MKNNTTIYNEASFAACQFNPLTPDRLIKTYPALSAIIAIENGRDDNLDRLLRYTIMVYDPRSPLVAAERDLNYRKTIAADLAGFDMGDEMLLTSIYECSYPALGDLTMKYLMRFPKSREWAAICAIEFKYWESIRKLIDPITGKSSREELDAVQKKSTIADEIDKDLARLENYYKAFFGEDESLERKIKKRMTPEIMAIKKSNNVPTST